MSAGARRVVGFGLAALVLLVPSGRAVADDDPAPVPWPTISKPDSGGTSADPGPIGWPAVPKPESTGNGADPAPRPWPAPQKPA